MKWVQQRVLRLWLWAVVLLITMVSHGFAATCGPATSPGTAPPSWQTYCWIDMTSYNNATVMGGGQPFSVTLSDGSIFSFTLSGTATSGTGLQAVTIPSWSGSAVGNSAFLGIPNRPVLYTTAGGTVDLTMSSITVTPPASGVSTGIFRVVIADGESSNGGESLRYTTNGGNWVEIDQVQNGTSNIYPGVTNTGTVYTNTGVAGTVGAYIVGSQSPSTVNIRLVAGGLQGIMIAVQYATISVNKVIVGSRANPADQFTFGTRATATSNIISSGTSTGTALGPFLSSVSTISASLPVTIFESMAAGSVSTLAQYTTSLTCTNGNSGSPTVLPTAQAVTTYNIPSLAYGDAIACTFTNTPRPATVTVQKTTAGAVGGPFTFTRTNLASAPPSITTTASNTPTPAAPTPINVSSYNTAVTITETPATNFSLTSATCTDANAALTGNTGSFGTVAGNVLTIAATNVRAGAQINCTFTNTLNAGAATVSVQKTTLGAAGGPFTFATTTNLNAAPAAVTTGGAGTPFPASPSPVLVTTVGSLVRITETLAANFTIVSANCTNSASATPTATFGTLVGNQLTIPAANVVAGARINCIFTNIVDPAIPVVAVQKITTGLAGGPFSFTSTNLQGTIANITTTAADTATPATAVSIPVTSILNPVTITETPNGSFNLSTASCIDTNSGVTGNPASFGSLAGNVLTIPVANVRPFARIVCTFTNAPRPPTLTLQKITTGSFGGPFTFLATNLSSAIGNISTTAASTATPASPTAVQVTTVNTAVTITEGANPSFTATAASCVDANAAFTGNPASFGSLAGNVLTVPAVNVRDAAQIQCTITNAAVPATVKVLKTTTGAGGGPFTFAVSNLSAAPGAITTSTAGTPAPATPTILNVSTLNSLVQISEASNPFFSIASASCTDANAAVTGNTGTFGTLTGLLLAIPAARVVPAADITCTFTNAGNAPRIRWQKALSGSGRIAAVDQFSLQATGTGAPANVTTTGTGAAITSAAMSFTATAGASYSLTEAMAAGSSSLITAYAKSVNCTNANSNGTVIPSQNTVPVTFTAQAADDISCTVTNNGAALPRLSLVKSYTTATTPVVQGQQITYIYTVTNTGNVNLTNVSVTDMHGVPAFQVPLGLGGIRSEVLTVPGPLGVGASPDSTPNDGIWSTLAPGATIEFRYIHSVTLAEFNGG